MLYVNLDECYFFVKDLEESQILLQTQDLEEFVEFILPKIGVEAIYDYGGDFTFSVDFQKELFEKDIRSAYSPKDFRRTFEEVKKFFKSHKYSIRFGLEKSMKSFDAYDAVELKYNYNCEVAKQIYNKIIDYIDTYEVSFEEASKEIFEEYGVITDDY